MFLAIKTAHCITDASARGLSTVPRILTEPELHALAQAIAPALRAGDALLLQGDLAAGKTSFARALIQHWLWQDKEPAAINAADGIKDKNLPTVPSPTFTLVQTYESAQQGLLHHYDLYRIKQVAEILDLGWEEALQDIVLVEWPENLGALCPPRHLWLSFAHAPDPEKRELSLSARGDGWAHMAAWIDACA